MKEGRPQPQRPNHHPDDNNRNNNRSRSRKSHQRMAFFLGMVSFATSGIRTATNTNSIANRVSGVALASWVVTPLPVAPHRQQQQQHRQQPQHHQYHRLFAASTHKNQRIVIATPQPSKHTATTTTTTAQPNRRVRPQQQQQLPPLLRNTNASMPVVALGSIGNDRPATATTPILSTTTSTAATATARTRTTPPPSSTPPPTTTPTMHTDNTKPDLRLLNLATATRADLTALIVDGLHHPKFRVDQVWQWIRGDAGVTDPYAMHNVPRALQVQLDTYCKTSRSSSSTTTSASSKGGSLLHCVLEQVSKVDGTIKRAYQCNSDATTINNNIDNKPTLIESVLMGPYRDGRYTACISSQAGCAQGCVFCATGQMGLTRQLTSDEILEQVVQFQNLLKQQNKKNIAANKKNKTNAESNDTESSSAPVSSSLPTTARLSNIVFMGMGEPLANYKNVKEAVRRITTDLGIGARRITVSTVGIVPGIRRLTTDPDMPPVRLAVSLHCANDEERTALLPANARNGGIHELMTALQDYIASTGRRITLEWALIAGENDNVSTARQLGRLIVQKYKLRPDMVHINVIPLNPTALYSGQASRKSAVNLFCDTLINEFSIACTPRVRRGIDIDAGCGQLTSSLIQQEEKQQNQNEREEQIHLVGYDIDFVNSGIPSPTNERLVDLASGPGLADFMAVASNSNSPRRSIVSSIGVFDPDDDDANDPDMDAVTDDTLQTFMTCTTNEGDAHDFDSDSFENPELESLFEKQEANRLVALIQGQTINIAALKTNERTTNTRE